MITIPKKKRHPQLVLLVLLVFFVISFITNILNSIIVAVKESFDLSLSAAGLLPFSFFIAYAVMSIPAGIMTERFSSRALLTGSFVVIVLSCFSLVMNPNYFFFLLTLFVLGLCMAVLQVIINPMLRVAGGEEHFAFNSVMAQVVFWVCIIFKSTLIHAIGQYSKPKYTIRDHQSMDPKRHALVEFICVFRCFSHDLIGYYSFYSIS